MPERNILPRKRFYRQRAHANPLAHKAFVHPPTPDDFDWPALYPELRPGGRHEHEQVEFADVGCGFGGLLFALAPVFPDKLMLGQSFAALASLPLLLTNIVPRCQASRSALK